VAGPATLTGLGEGRSASWLAGDVDVGELVDEPPCVLRGCRAQLKLVETAPLVLGGIGQEAGYEDLPVRRIRTAPAQADDIDAGLGEVELVAGAGALAPALGV
jgi:hypothetical protein